MCRSTIQYVPRTRRCQAYAGETSIWRCTAREPTTINVYFCMDTLRTDGSYDGYWVLALLFRVIRTLRRVLVNTTPARISAVDHRQPLDLVDAYLHPEQCAISVLGENTGAPAQMSAGLSSWKVIAYNSDGVSSGHRNW